MEEEHYPKIDELMKIEKKYLTLERSEGLTGKLQKSLGWELRRKGTKYNIPFTLYVTLNTLDTEGYLSAEDIKSLSSLTNCEIGSHSYDHVKLDTISNDYNTEFRFLIKHYLNYVIRFRKEYVSINFMKVVEFITHVQEPDTEHIKMYIIFKLQDIYTLIDSKNILK